MPTKDLYYWISRFLQGIVNQNYAFIKWREHLTAYNVGDDLDIICGDNALVVHQLLIVGNQFVAQGGEVSVWESDNQEQVHFDLIVDQELFFRFDLYNGLPHYSTVKLSTNFLDFSLDTRVSLPFEGGIAYRTVKEVDMVFRYVEYLEFGAVSPRKQKHYDWVVKNLYDAKVEFVNLLQLYTDFPITLIQSVSAGQLMNRDDFLAGKEHSK